MKKTQRPSFFKRFLSFLLIVSALFSLSTYVSAHEIFYDGLIPYPLRWSVMSGGKVSWKIYNLGLSSFYSKHFNTVAYAWKNACPNQITASITKDYGAANICILQPSESSWDSLLGPKRNLLGYCEPMNSDRVYIKDLETAKKTSNRKIIYAKIYLTPYTEKVSNDTEAKAVMVHELGHALGLGHPTSDIDPSIMLSPPYSPKDNRTFWLPQNHDKTDVANFY